MRLNPGCWLDDAVINHFIALLLLRTETEAAAGDGAVKPSHVFNTYFYLKVGGNVFVVVVPTSRSPCFCCPQLNGEGPYNYGNVRRWTRRKPLFDKHQVIVPVNLSNVRRCRCV